MSISKFERGKYIKGWLMDKALSMTGQPDAVDRFAELYNLIDEIDTAGNPNTDHCANHPSYLDALKSWQAASRAEAERLVRSRSL